MKRPSEIANLLLWLKADAIAGLSDGDAVASWPDSGSNGYTFAQGTPANRPIYKTAIQNGRPVVRFTAASAHTLTSSASLASQSAFTIFVVRSRTASTPSAGVCVHSSGGTNGVLVRRTGGSSSAIVVTGGITRSFAESSTAMLRQTWRYRGSVPSLEAWQDGVSKTLSGAGTIPSSIGASAGTLTLGGVASDYWDGDVCEVVIYTAALSDSDIAEVEAYLNAKWFGVLLEPTAATVTATVPAVGLSASGVAPMSAVAIAAAATVPTATVGGTGTALLVVPDGDGPTAASTIVATLGSSSSAYPIRFRYEAELAGVGAGWTDITSDVMDDPVVRLSYGIGGGGVEDLTAETGTLSFAMANYATPGGRPEGYYSPSSPRCRAGWTWDIRIRLTAYVDLPTPFVLTRWLGYLDDIDVQPGIYGDRLVPCVAVDMMAVFAASPATVAIQVGQTEDAVVGAILDASPIAPAARDLDAGVDTLPYALDRGDDTLLSALQATALSCRGYVYVKRDATHGQTLRYEARTSRQSAVSPKLTLTDTDLVRLTQPDRSITFDRLRVTCHPRVVVPEASMTGPVAIEGAVPTVPLAPGASETILLDYSDPAQRDTRIGAANCLVPWPSTDYLFNSAADGSGTNLTGSILIAADFWGDGCSITVTNLHPTMGAYRTMPMQVRGDGVYTLSDVTVESAMGVGRRVRMLDMPYQADVSVAQSTADGIVPLYLTPTALVESVSVEADRSHAMRKAVIGTDIGDAIDAAETMTGVAHRFFVQGVAWDIGPRERLTATYTLAPSMAAAWELDTATLGVDTRLGA